MAVNNNLEGKIVETARQLFIKNGFVETNMCDIAAAVGINRPTLHYYFRTKDKMFQAVFGNIVQSVVPVIHEIISQDKPFVERLDMVIDAYIDAFISNPYLPMFIMREIGRDVDHLVNTARELHLEQYFRQIYDILESEMENGGLKRVPMHVVFFTFYGALTFPFMVRNLSSLFYTDNDNESFESIVRSWKPYIIMQMKNLLCYN